MAEFDLFPIQGESILANSLWFQKSLIGLGGCGVLKDLSLELVLLKFQYLPVITPIME
jgi:hypothetical protein